MRKARTTFVELGPGTVLAGLIKKIDRSVTVVSVEAPEHPGAGPARAISWLDAPVGRCGAFTPAAYWLRAGGLSVRPIVARL